MSYPHIFSYPCQYICSLSQSDLQSTTIENIVYKLNKTKSSWKLKTYTCYCSIKKNTHRTTQSMCVCVCVQIQSGPSSFDIETNRIYCPKMLIHVEVLSFNFHWKCKHMAILFLLHSMCWHWLLLLTHITKDLHTHSTAHQQCTTS